MSRLPKDIISVSSPAAVVAGALLAPGKRTVSAVLEVMGLGAEPRFKPIIVGRLFQPPHRKTTW